MTHDFTDIRNLTIQKSKLQGIDPSFFDHTDTMYFDETGNQKTFYITEDGYNIPDDIHFVLGGIVTSGVTVTADEIKSVFRMQPNQKEIKSKHIYDGDFARIMNSKKLTPFFNLIISKGLFFHFQHCNLMWFALVNIIDSVKNPLVYQCNAELKSVLYLVYKENRDAFHKVIYDFKYPNIQNGKIPDFYERLLKIAECSIAQHKDDRYHPLLVNLVQCLLYGTMQQTAASIQDEAEWMLLKRMGDFYLSNLYLYTRSTQIYDKESDIEKFMDNVLKDCLPNTILPFTKVDSIDEPMVQLSDIAVGVLSRYFKFLDRSFENIITDFKNFNVLQKQNFKLLNDILRASLSHNPLFIHSVCSSEEHANLISVLDVYEKFVK